jgi:LPXTG-site transpeptidase (sortase) family protein
VFDQPEPSSDRNWSAEALTWGGMMLLLAGIILMGLRLAPFLDSRLHPAPTRVSLLQPTTTQASSSSPHLVPPQAAEGEGPTSDPAEIPPTPTPTPVPYQPTRIIISAIDLDAPVVTTTWEIVNVQGQEQTVWAVPPRRAAGWHEDSAPLNVPGNTVINGHNTTRGEVFRDLYKLEPGDRIVLYSDEISFTYEITETLLLPEGGQPLEVRVTNAKYIQPTRDERVTLVTCHPYASLEYRLVVIAQPAEPTSPGESEEQ